ncbi:MAG: 50S ribosomal protein L33 [Mycoplasma sp.]|nr:50S ribosomal protein L33 [Mycoplasma sp.]
MKSKIMLACEICHTRNYKTNKSKEERVRVKKFCKKCRKHTMHLEEK